jgi:integrase/recombinase XerD
MYFRLFGKRTLKTDSLVRPRRSRSLPKVFSKEEVMRIFNVTRNNKHKLMLWLIYSCGLRRGEVINIKLTDLDTDRGILHIREGKGNVDRMVPVAQKVWEKIRAYINVYKLVSYM